MFEDALPEFRAGWLLAGKRESTVDFYIDLLSRFASNSPEPNFEDARSWVACASTDPMRRKRAQSVRAFGQWSESIGDNDFPWWRHVPVLTEKEKPQPTATVDDFEAGMKALGTIRDRPRTRASSPTRRNSSCERRMVSRGYVFMSDKFSHTTGMFWQKSAGYCQ